MRTPTAEGSERELRSGRQVHRDRPGDREGPASGPLDELRAGLRTLLATVLDTTFGLALEKVEALARSFDDMAVRGGPRLHALLGGGMAELEGRNPVWGAVRGAFAALSPAARAALITALVLALLLVPVTVVLLLLVLIVVAVAAAARGAG